MGWFKERFLTTQNAWSYLRHQMKFEDAKTTYSLSYGYFIPTSV